MPFRAWNPAPAPTGEAFGASNDKGAKMKRLIGTVCALVLAAVAVDADAAIVRFTISGDYSAAWDLTSPATPSDYLNGSGAVFWTVSGTFSGAVQPEADITFFNAAGGGGLNIYDFQAGHGLLSTDGPQLYTGPESAPVFKLGTFALTEFQGTGSYTLTVAEVATVPEPASAAMALTGLMLLYGGRRYRRAL
jgi:hypothetical protein